MKVEMTEANVTQLMDLVKRIADFSEEQIPLLAQEILYWGKVYHLSWFAFGFLVMLLSLYGWQWAHKRKDTFSDSVTGTILKVVACIFIFVGFMISFGNLHYLLQIHFASRLYLVEELSRMVQRTAEVC